MVLLTHTSMCHAASAGTLTMLILRFISWSLFNLSHINYTHMHGGRYTMYSCHPARHTHRTLISCLESHRSHTWDGAASLTPTRLITHAPMGACIVSTCVDAFKCFAPLAPGDTVRDPILSDHLPVHVTPAFAGRADSPFRAG